MVTLFPRIEDELGFAPGFIKPDFVAVSNSSQSVAFCRKLPPFVYVRLVFKLLIRTFVICNGDCILRATLHFWVVILSCSLFF